MSRERVEAVLAEVLAGSREVNGGELESVLTIYKPEGLAVLCYNALRDQGHLRDAAPGGGPLVMRYFTADELRALLEAWRVHKHGGVESGLYWSMHTCLAEAIIEAERREAPLDPPGPELAHWIRTGEHLHEHPPEDG